MTEHKIVPSVATDEMKSTMADQVLVEEVSGAFDDTTLKESCDEIYQAALSAAPDTSHLVIVERAMLEGLVKETQTLIELSRRWYGFLCRLTTIRNSACVAAQDTEDALAKIKDILNDK